MGNERELLAVGMPVQHEAQFQHRFSTHLCDCCAGEDALETCWLSYFCPCVVFGRNIKQLGPQPRVWFNGNSDSACLTHGGLLCLVAGAASIINNVAVPQFPVAGLPLHLLDIIPHLHARSAIREKYGIKGNAVCDCCTVFWCRPCALCQEHRQLQVPPVDFAMQATGPACMELASKHASQPVVSKDGGYYTAVPLAPEDAA